MKSQFSGYIKICAISLLASTVLVGCSLWSDDAPPRYNTVQGGKRVPALNPGGNGNVGNPLAVNPAASSVKQAPVSMGSNMPYQSDARPLVDEATRQMLFDERFDEPSSAQISAPVESVTSRDYPVLSNVPNIKNEVIDSKKPISKSIDELSKERDKSHSSVASQPNSSSGAKYMAGEKLPDEMQPWSVGGDSKVRASSIPSHPTLSTPKGSNKPVSGKPLVASSIPDKPVAIIPPIKDSSTGWRSVSPEVPKEVVHSGEEVIPRTDRVMNESGDIQSVTNVDYPSDVSEEDYAEPIALVPPSGSGAYSSGAMRESRYAKRLRSLRRSRSSQQ